MKIESKFELAQQVTINESGAKGVVVCFYLDEAHTLWVRVRRIGDDARADYFLESALTAC